LRAQNLGLQQKLNAFQRYFFLIQENSTKFSKNNLVKNDQRAKTKLYNFYKTLNQLAIHKIQKRMQCFQNPVLWSSLILRKNHLNHNKLEDQESNVFLNDVLFSKISKNLLINSPAILSLFFKENFSKNQEFSKNLHSSKLMKHNSEKSFLQLGRNQLLDSDFLKEKGENFLSNLVIYKKIKYDLKNRQNSLGSLNSKYHAYFESFLSKFYKIPHNLNTLKVRNEWQYASYLADEIVFFLEKRVPFRKLKSKLLKQLTKNSQIRGIRITCSGRVGGKSKKAQRAKTECIKYGQTSLHVFSSPIDFSCKTARTSFGSVGIKVWICYH